MSQFVHEKDKYGHDYWYLDGGDVRSAPAGHITDFRQQLTRIKNMELRPDDVIMAAFPKSGNNWIHHMATMLMEGTTEIPTEILKNDNYVFLDGCAGDNELPPPTQPRTLWSHLPFRFLPRDVTEKKVKIIYLMRNPKDVFVSMFCYLKHFGPPVGYDGTWSEFFSVMLERGWWNGEIFEYLRDWERTIANNSDVPIFTMTYEDTKQDTVGQVQRLNDFLGTKRDRQFCQAVADKCCFHNMPHIRQLDKNWRDQCNWKNGAKFNVFYRKGMVGDWKNWFTVAQNEQFEKMYRAKMAGSKLRFVFE